MKEESQQILAEAQLAETTVVDSLQEAPLEVEGLKSIEPMPMFIPQTLERPLWRTLLSGILTPKRTEPKVNRFWYEGRLLTQEEHDKLSVDEILASNNIVRRRK